MDVQEQGEEEALIVEQSREGEAYGEEEVERTSVDVDRTGMEVEVEVEEVEAAFPFPFPKDVEEEGEEDGKTFVVVQVSFEAASVETEEEGEEMVALLETPLYVPKEQEQTA